MSSKRKMDHLERTANNYRQLVSSSAAPLCHTFACSLSVLSSVCVCVFCVISPQALYPAQVCGIINESETVKRLRIAAHADFSFKAGQW